MSLATSDASSTTIYMDATDGGCTIQYIFLRTTPDWKYSQVAIAWYAPTF